MIKEELLHFVWKNGLFSAKSLITLEGTVLEVIHPGEQNFHAGPDFFNARLRLGRIVWAGNVEIHRHASDWNKHGHQLDPAYDNVVLHVVHHWDAIVRNSKGRQIQTLVVERSDALLERVEELKRKECWIPCGRNIAIVPEHMLKPWLHKLTEERLDLRTAHLASLLTRQVVEREKMFCLAVASGFGLPINCLPFELLVSGIPASLLHKLISDLHDLEALFFGRSGLLQTGRYQDSYTRSLIKGYNKFKNTLPCRPLPPHLWKFLRIRPASFPTLRISQYASFIHSHYPRMEDLIRTGSIADIERYLQVSASEYWNTHYIFERSSPFSIKWMGKQAIQHIIINVIIPCFLAIQRIENGINSVNNGKEILRELKTESNQIVKNWIKFGIKPSNAFESQALIQLYKGYCMQKRCDQCPIGKAGRG